MAETATNAALKLGPALTIVEASQTHMSLLEQVALSTEGMKLDLSGVSEFDSAGLQLLLSLKSGLARQGRLLELCDLSQTVADALAVYGLGPDLRPLSVESTRQG